jgi:hypothetical protein
MVNLIREQQWIFDVISRFDYLECIAEICRSCEEGVRLVRIRDRLFMLTTEPGCPSYLDSLALYRKPTLLHAFLTEGLPKKNKNKLDNSISIQRRRYINVILSVIFQDSPDKYLIRSQGGA